MLLLWHLHNTCNICIHDLPDMYICPQPLGLWPSGFGIHIRQILHAHVATITCTGYLIQKNGQPYIYALQYMIWLVTTLLLLLFLLSQKGQGAPGREPLFSEEEKKQMMLHAYHRQEQLKVHIRH